MSQRNQCSKKNRGRPIEKITEAIKHGIVCDKCNGQKFVMVSESTTNPDGCKRYGRKRCERCLGKGVIQASWETTALAGMIVALDKKLDAVLERLEGKEDV